MKKIILLITISLIIACDSSGTRTKTQVHEAKVRLCIPGEPCVETWEYGG